MWHKTFMSKTLVLHKTSSPTTTKCRQTRSSIGKHFRRQVSARFDGGVISSDGGRLLLREVDRRIKLLPRQRVSNQDASEDSVAGLKRIVAQIRGEWPEVRIIVRGGWWPRQADLR